MSFWGRLLGKKTEDPESFPVRNAFVIEIEFKGNPSEVAKAADAVLATFAETYGHRIGSGPDVTFVPGQPRVASWSFGGYCKSMDEAMQIMAFAEDCARRHGFRAGGR